MGKIKENGKQRRRRPAGWLCLLSLAFLTACGCSAANKNKGDPLLGEFGPKGGEIKPPATKTSSNQVPPIPTASYGINNANLAAGTLPGSRNLAITDPQPSNNGPGSLTAGSKTNAGTVLANPQPIVQPVPRDNSTVVPASNWANGQPPPPPPNPALTQQSSPPTAAPGQQPDSDPFQAQFKARGVTWRNAENVAGGVRVTCIVPNPQNPQVTRAYEAVGPDYPAAARAVLWEIDNRK